jgi:hypothetical protein
MTNNLFQILGDNMFNLKEKESNSRLCNGTKIYSGYHSYIYSVKWEHFVTDSNSYIDIAKTIRQNINDYEITKTVK